MPTTKRTIYRDANGRFISKHEAKRRGIRGRRVAVRIPPRDDYGRFIPLPAPEPLPEPTPTFPTEDIFLTPTEQDELDEYTAMYPELDELDDTEELIEDEEAWYHGEGAREAWLKDKQKKHRRKKRNRS